MSVVCVPALGRGLGIETLRRLNMMMTMKIISLSVYLIKTVMSSLCIQSNIYIRTTRLSVVFFSYCQVLPSVNKVQYIFISFDFPNGIRIYLGISEKKKKKQLSQHYI